MLFLHNRFLKSRHRLTGITLCLVVFCAPLLLAANPSQSDTTTVSKESATDKTTVKKSSATKRNRKIINSIDPNQEKQAIAFAKSHHPELAKLIQRLKKRKPLEYRRAIRDLDMTLTKLDRFKKRDGERYRLTLELWEVDSRIRLLAARVSVMGNSKDKTELKSLIQQRIDLRLELLRHDLKLAENRIERLNKSIADMEQNQDKIMDAELKKIQRSIKSTDKKQKNK